MLIVTKSDLTTYVCSSVAYSRNVLITAAHCLVGAIKVQVCQQDTINKKNTFYTVDYFECHKNYNPLKSNYLYDIGKVYLNILLPSEINICPISDLTDLSSSLFRVGYGLRDGVNTHTLVSNIKNFTNFDKYFTAYEEYSFSGDSGGPLFQKHGNQLYLVGIHSTRQGYSSYNPKPFAFKRWLNQQ